MKMREGCALKRFSGLICALLTLALVSGCSQTGNTLGSLFTGTNTGSPGTAFTPPVSVQTPSTGYVEEAEMTLSFAFGKRSGTYSGQTANGLPHGEGIFAAFVDGGVGWTYTGDWSNGHFQGQGETVWANGWREEGTYSGDYLISGRTYWEDHLTYEGNYRAEEYHGNGTLYDIAGNVIFTGQFKDGYLVEDEEHRITRADMLAPECDELTTKVYSNIMKNGSAYVGRKVYVHGKIVERLDDGGAFGEFVMAVEGKDGYYFDLHYRYGQGEPRIDEGDWVTVFGIVAGVFAYEGTNDDSYNMPLVEAHVIYID
jgi:hypothetical protein